MRTAGEVGFLSPDIVKSSMRGFLEIGAVAAGYVSGFAFAGGKDLTCELSDASRTLTER